MADPTQASIVTVKSFNYRGSVKLFRNRCYLNSTSGPADQTKWHTLMDNVTDEEKILFPSFVTIVEAIGYEGGSDLPIASKTYTKAGTVSMSSATACPGDCAAMLRYTTDQRSSKNHPIYLFNYFHGALYQTTGTTDTIAATQKTAIESYAAAWIAGYSDGSVTFKRAGPRGAVAQTAACDPYVRHRDFSG